jgi:outer membrane protein OmpA-like peptidoglycan-associated protein
MKQILLIFFLLTQWFPFCQATNGEGDQQEIKYTDYLPRYRKLTNDFLISKVDYGNQNTILYFRVLVASDKEIIRFFGCQHPNAWAINTSQKAANSNENLSRAATVSNIRINDVKKQLQLSNTESVEIKAQKGDIVSCEIHFKNMPIYVKTINLVGGDMDKAAVARFVCYDLQLKTQAGGLLADKIQMQANIEQFYKLNKNVRYPSIIELTTVGQDSMFAKQHKKYEDESKKITNITDSEPIDYMPKMLNKVSDLSCNERFILQNVYFEEETSEFTRRLQAVKSIAMISEYMEHYPDSKISLHGHTDIFGDTYNNLLLSQKRVMAVQRVLIDKGVDKKRIIINYYGGQYPLPLYKDGGPMNRRVEAEVLCPKK